MDCNDLLALVVKLQCQLFESISIAATDIGEWDTTKLVYNRSMLEERSIPATKPKSKTSLGNIKVQSGSGSKE